MGSKGKGRKQGQKKRVSFRRNRQKPARDKDWTRRLREDGAESIETREVESVVAKGDLSRKRTVVDPDQRQPEENLRDGIVIAMRGLFADVDDGERIWPCTVRRVLRTRLIDERHPVTVGDKIRFSIVADKEGVEREGVIEAVADRKGILTRVAGRRVHTVVANVDQAVIVSSVHIPALKRHLIDRYIVAARHGEVEPIICVNKMELDDAGEGAAALELYRSLGYRSVATSAVSGMGIEELRSILVGSCSAIAGQSGVGKSSLLNAVDPNLNLRVGQVIEDTSKGRHTTTTATLIKLDGGGYVVDTPGVKSFDVTTVPLPEIEAHFIELHDLVPHCRFPDCTHTHETDCEVKRAVKDGRLADSRYDSFVRLLEERASEARRMDRDD